LALGSSIKQDDRVVNIKSDDSIFVVGKNNKIIVTSQMLIEGELLFDESSELIFEFDDKVENSEVIFADNYNLNLKPRSRLEFRGNGSVKFANGGTINFQGTNVSDPKPVLIFSDSSVLSLMPNSLVNIYGIGKILVDNGGEIRIGGGQHLVIGAQESDNIDIKVDRNSVIRVDSKRDVSLYAIISMQKSNYTLDFEQGAMLTIGKNGTFEINALNGNSVPGILSEFKFDINGILNIEVGGNLIIGRNRLIPPTYEESKINWDNLDGVIQYNKEGNGTVKLAGTDFVGQLQNNKFENSLLTASELVSLLVKYLNFTGSENLKVSTLFIDIDGQQKIRTKDGVIVALLEDDEIREDSEVYGYVYGINKGRPFIIYPNGVRG